MAKLIDFCTFREDTDDNGKTYFSVIGAELNEYISDWYNPNSRLRKYYSQGFDDRTELELVLLRSIKNQNINVMSSIQFPKKIKIFLGKPDSEAMKSLSIDELHLVLLQMQRYRLLRNCAHIVIEEQNYLNMLSTTETRFVKRLAIRNAIRNLLGAIFKLESLTLQVERIRTTKNTFILTKLLKKLETLELSNVDLIVPYLVKNNRLENLKLQYTNIRGVLDLGRNKCLKNLEIYDCMNDDFSVNTSRLKNLKSLVIVESNIVEIELSTNENLEFLLLDICEKLDTLDITRNKKLTDITITATSIDMLDIRNNTNLESLKIDANIKIVFGTTNFSKVYKIELYRYDDNKENIQPFLNHLKKCNPNLEVSFDSD